MAGPKRCWACSKKRLVCDLARPGCRKCEIRGITCPGYDKMPLTWLNPGQTRSKGKVANYERAFAAIEQGLPNVQPKRMADDVIILMDSIRYYNEVMVSDAVAIPWPTHTSPFVVEPIHLPYFPEAMVECLFCISLAHRIMRTSATMPSDKRLILAKRLQDHRGKSIRLLAADLAGEETRTSDATLVTIFTFLLSELQQCLTPINWSEHCDGAHAIITARGGLRQLMLEGTYEYMVRYFLITEIFGSTTTPFIPERQAMRQLEVIDLLPGYFLESLTTSVPCPAPILQAVVHINHRRWVNQAMKASEDEAFTSMTNILTLIRSFSVESWVTDARKMQDRVAEEGGDEASSNSRSESPQQQQPESWSWPWSQMAHAYQGAASLYCMSSLFGFADEKEWPYMDKLSANRHEQVQFLTDSARKSLLGNLKEISSSPKTHHRKLIMWPLTIAGITSENDEDGSRSYILSELQWIAQALGTASAMVAYEYLKTLWKQPKRKSTPSDFTTKWDTMFDHSYVFAV